MQRFSGWSTTSEIRINGSSDSTTQTEVLLQDTSFYKLGSQFNKSKMRRYTVQLLAANPFPLLQELVLLPGTLASLSLAYARVCQPTGYHFHCFLQMWDWICICSARHWLPSSVQSLDRCQLRDSRQSCHSYHLPDLYNVAWSRGQEIFLEWGSWTFHVQEHASTKKYTLLNTESRGLLSSECAKINHMISEYLVASSASKLLHTETPSQKWL